MIDWWIASIGTSSLTGDVYHTKTGLMNMLNPNTIRNDTGDNIRHYSGRSNRKIPDNPTINQLWTKTIGPMVGMSMNWRTVPERYGHQYDSTCTNKLGSSWGLFTIQWKNKTKDDYISYKHKVDFSNNYLNFYIKLHFLLSVASPLSTNSYHCHQKIIYCIKTYFMLVILCIPINPFLPQPS